MQKIKHGLILIIAVAILFNFSYGIDIKVNSSTINLPVDAIIQNSRTLVPLRVLAEIFGADVDWQAPGNITVYYQDRTIKLNVGSSEIDVDGKFEVMDTNVIEKDNYTMMPLNFFADYFNIELEWYESSRTVNMVIKDEVIVERAETVSRSYSRDSIYKGYTVVIDPGHGGADNGAYYGGVAEKTINLAIAGKVKDILKKYDINAYMTRTSDVTTSLASRTSLANKLEADLYISIHSNAIANSNIRGTEILYKSNTLIKKGITNKILAQNLSAMVSEYAATYERGLINRTNLFVLNKTSMPAAIVEVAYMTNSSDLRNLKKESFKDDVAEGITEGILKTLMTMIKN